jgi:hypothetical protein
VRDVRDEYGPQTFTGAEKDGRVFDEFLWRSHGGRCPMLVQTGKSDLETLRKNGLQQIIHSANLEGTYGVFIISCNEDDLRHGIDEGQEIKTQAARHLKIQEEECRVHLGTKLGRLGDAGSLADDLDIRVSSQEFAEVISCRSFVVDDEGAPIHEGSILWRTS